MSRELLSISSYIVIFLPLEQCYHTFFLLVFVVGLGISHLVMEIKWRQAFEHFTSPYPFLADFIV